MDELNLPVYKILILTSCARGGATSTSSILRGSPAPQQTAALHVMGFPAVSDMAVLSKRGGKIGRGLPPRADIIAEPSPNQFSLGRADAGLSFSFRGLVSLSATTTNSSLHPASHHLHLTRRTQREESCLSPICITRGCV